MDYEQVFDELYSKHGKANFYRGFMIQSFVLVEKRIEEYLIEYFIKNVNKQIEFNEIIIDRLNFEAKRTAFKTILDNESALIGFVKTKNNTYPHSKLLNEIRLLNDERVKFAHYFIMDLLKNPIETANMKDKIFGLAEYRDSLKIIWYTKEKYMKIIELSVKVSGEIFNLIETLKIT